MDLLRRWRRVSLAILLTAWPTVSYAQLSVLGSPIQAASGGTSYARTDDAGFDSTNNVFLMVTTEHQTGRVFGSFANTSGSAIGGGFRIDTSSNFPFGPAIAYSPAANVFLVVWVNDAAQVRGRLVRYGAGALGSADVVLGTGGRKTWAPAIAYSATSQEFLVSWSSSAGPNWIVRVSTGGATVGSPLQTTGNVWTQEPALAWNPTNNEFLLAYAQEINPGWQIRVQRISQGQLIGAPQTVHGAGSTKLPDVSYSTLSGKFLVTWFQGNPYGIYGRLMNADATPAGAAQPMLPSSYGSYDANSLAYNDFTDTFVVASITPQNSLDTIGGAEISSTGVPSTAMRFVEAAAGTGNRRYPEVAASSANGRFLTIYNRSQSSFWGQTLNSGTGGGGSEPPPPCSVTVSGSNASFGGGGGAGSFGVTVSSGSCNWTAVSNVNWIQVSPSSGSTSQTVTYTVQSNPSYTAGRSGTVTVAGQSFTITQAARVESVPGDFDGDGLADASYFRASTGTWATRLSSTGAVEEISWGGLPGDVPLLGDFDGDTRPDPTFFRPADGCWYILSSSTQTPSYICWGGRLEDKPVPADYDGDGKTDAAFYRPSERYWYILQSSTNTPRYVFWGSGAGDVPAPADYDGDRKADVAFYKPSDRYWYVLRSSNNGPQYVFWGSGATDVPVPADYDGDGKADHAFFKPTDGYWYIRQSSNGLARYVFWGNASTNMPAPGDYDGDRRADVAFFEAPYFYIIKSTTGLATYYNFGAVGDVPVLK